MYLQNADIYRSLANLSWFGKLFTSILYQRINNVLEKSGLLSEEQAVFFVKVMVPQIIYCH